MGTRVKVWALLGAIVALQLAVFAAAIAAIYFLVDDADIRTRVLLYLGGAVFLVTASLVILFTFIDVALLRALRDRSKSRQQLEPISVRSLHRCANCKTP